MRRWFTLLFLGVTAAAAEPAPISQIRVLVVEAGQERMAGATVPAPKELELRLAHHMGRPATEAELGALADVVVEHLRSHHWPVSLVTVWDEDDGLADGSVTLQVQQGRIGDIAIIGGSARRQRQAARRVQDLAHSPLDSLKLQRRLDALAFSPWLAVSSIASQGDALDTANLTLALAEQWPIHAFAAYENNGVEPLGLNRYSVGLQWLNAFALGQDLTLVGTTTDDPETFSMLAGSWCLPLPWRHELRATGYYADTSSTAEVLGVPLDISGTTWTAGARYVVPWRWSDEWRSEWNLGFDCKQFDTAYTFGETALLGDTVGVGTLLLGTQWFYDRKPDQLMLAFEAAHSEPGWAAGEQAHEFNDLSPGATPRFTTVRAHISWQHDFKDGMQSLFRIAGQWADHRLLASEELPIASVNAVRGYPERSIRASRGAWASVEASSAVWSIKGGLKLRAIAFTEGGCIADEFAASDFIASAGIGVRAELTAHLQLRSDLAVPLIRVTHESLEPRVHISAVFRF